MEMAENDNSKKQNTFKKRNQIHSLLMSILNRQTQKSKFLAFLLDSLFCILRCWRMCMVKNENDDPGINESAFFH